MLAGSIIFVDFGMQHMYLRLAKDLPEDMSKEFIIHYKNRVDVKMVSGSDASGNPTINTMWMRVGNTVAISKSVPSKLRIPENVIVHICPIDESSREYKDLIAEFTAIAM